MQKPGLAGRVSLWLANGEAALVSDFQLLEVK
jgi:hypothetical protein